MVEEHNHDLDDEAQVPATPLEAAGVSSEVPVLSESEKALIATCLPTSLQALDAAGAKQVAALLAERIQAGWQPSQIRAAIGDRGLDGTRRLSSIAACRLRENVHPDMAPARLAQQADPRFLFAVSKSRETKGSIARSKGIIPAGNAPNCIVFANCVYLI